MTSIYKSNQSKFDEFSFESIFKSSPYGMLIISRDGKIIMSNPEVEKIFGYSESEFLEQNLDMLLPSHLRETHHHHVSQYFKDPSSRMMGNRDLFGIHKDGREILVEIKLTPIHYQDMGMVVLASVIDISGRKKDEKELKRLTEKLEEQVALRTEELSQAIKELLKTNEDLSFEMEKRKQAEEEALRSLEKEKDLSELKSRFVSMASHEFRTPLAGILTSASLIQKYVEKGDLLKTDKHVLTIKNSVKNLTMILNDFLSIDKLESDAIECRKIKFDLRSFLEEFIEEMNTLIKEGQEIILNVDDRIGEINSDRGILRNIMLNLVSNAIKYSPKNCHINIAVIHLQDKIEISVRDQGVGIPLEDQKYLFKRFFRAQNVTAIQGTGLGLNIVSRYLSLLGGQIRFESEENRGSIFIVSLPSSLKEYDNEKNIIN